MTAVLVFHGSHAARVTRTLDWSQLSGYLFSLDIMTITTGLLDIIERTSHSHLFSTTFLENLLLSDQITKHIFLYGDPKVSRVVVKEMVLTLPHHLGTF